MPESLGRAYQAGVGEGILLRHEPRDRLKIGSPLFFRGQWEGKAYEDKGTVLSFEPVRSLSFNYWSGFSGMEDRPESRQIIRYGLEETAEGVRVTIDQSNVDTQARADHSAKNWQGVLAGLKMMVEKPPSQP